MKYSEAKEFHFVSNKHIFKKFLAGNRKMKSYINKCDPSEKIKQEKEMVYCYTKNNKGHVIKLECNTETNQMRTLRKDPNSSKYVPLPENKLCKNDRIVLSENGDRWEGDSLNQLPHGFGSFYDGEGNRIYIGFVYKGQKAGFGEEYFADSHKVDYCGMFMNDKRHGWGCSYDRNGNKLFEGEWRYGFNNFLCCFIEEKCEIFNYSM